MGFQILQPAFHFPQPVHVVCRQAELGPLVNQLQAHRLDIVLADEPASSSLKAKTFNHRLGRSSVTFCAIPRIATKLRRNFPKSLHQAAALLPSENMGVRGPLEKWFYTEGIRPRIVGEFEDAGLMNIAASGGLGFTMVHTVVESIAFKHYGLSAIARVEECGSDFYAITIERRVKHPVAAAITEHAYSEILPENPFAVRNVVGRMAPPSFSQRASHRLISFASGARLSGAACAEGLRWLFDVPFLANFTGGVNSSPRSAGESARRAIPKDLRFVLAGNLFPPA